MIDPTLIYIDVDAPPDSQGQGTILFHQLTQATGTAFRAAVFPVEIRCLCQVGPVDSSITADYILSNGTPTGPPSVGPTGIISWSCNNIDSGAVNTTNTVYAAVHWSDGVKEKGNAMFFGVEGYGLPLSQIAKAARQPYRAAARILKLKTKDLLKANKFGSPGGPPSYEAGREYIRLLMSVDASAQTPNLKGIVKFVSDHQFAIESAELLSTLETARQSNKRIFFVAEGGILKIAAMI